MKPLLGYIHNKEIKDIRVISDDEYNDYTKASAVLFQFSKDEHLLVNALLNYDEFHQTLSAHAIALTEDGNSDPSNLDTMVAHINRRILNFLSSVRTFLDHTETYLNRRYGTSSDEFIAFKKAAAYIFDNNFSYRFLSHLRNYVQHCGMPVGNIEIMSKKPMSSNGQVEHTVVLSFDRDELLLSFKKWKPIIKNDLQAMPAYFNIVPHLEVFMLSIGDINAVVMERLLPRLIKHAKLIQKLVDEVAEISEGVPIIITDSKFDVSKGNMSYEPLPIHRAKAVFECQKSIDKINKK